jgi:transcriptional regulator with XRE-family HTH domain
MNIYLRIKELARKKRITYKEFAEALNVTEIQVTNYLNGRSKIIADQIPVFAKILKVPIEDLFRENGSDKSKSKSFDVTKSQDDTYYCPECIKKEKRLKELEAIIKDKQKIINQCEELLAIYRDEKRECC